ncbi:alpha/beta hydrolase family protein [Chitinophaga nivalis]|uniref:Alpha/beta fold hydrolase n=1 Tax=Chitinophaga nivalis TaxID=2991709 RepID=A0ABT3IPY9_9BACT|nr:alpha/beta fold hydrolase [Chitinophaga nivalis]MCW3464276.1 alpha/beta fold hydrolase [Chitinophaga nivalis]MCW3486033.1 alpha/beta fold hydrolase [Chitinophaga nivalis]
MYKCGWALLLCVCLCAVVRAQDPTVITGKWYGVATSYYGEKQRLIVTLAKQGTGYAGQLESPDQTAVALPFDQIVYRRDTLLLRIDDIRFAYTGVWDVASARFKGLFSWNGQQSRLDLSRTVINREDVSRRPQEPVAPYPYYTENVTFDHTKDSITLAGTFTRPATLGKYPVVVLISGSGAQDRNGEMAGHKTFLVLADYLARNGIASLRCDDRGTGASGGDHTKATIYDLAADVKSAMAYLKTRRDVDVRSIGLAGHSEGAAIAQIAAADNPAVAFVIAMAGPGLPGRELVDQQIIINGRLAGEPDSLTQSRLLRLKPYWDALAGDTNIAVAKARATEVLRDMYRHAPDSIKQQVSEEVFAGDINFTPEMSSLLLYKPLVYLRQIKCPVMAINGSRDIQVEADANLNAIERALRENGNMLVTIRKFEGLNHLFQRCKTCTVEEYGELEQTIDPMVPEFMSHWILQLPPTAK